MSDTTLQVGGEDTSLETASNWSDGVPTAGNGKRAVIPSGDWSTYTSTGATWASALVEELGNPPDLANVTISGGVSLAGTLKNATVGGNVIGSGVIYAGSIGGYAKATGALLLSNQPNVGTVYVAQGGSAQADYSLTAGSTSVVPLANTDPGAANVLAGHNYTYEGVAQTASAAASAGGKARPVPPPTA